MADTNLDLNKGLEKFLSHSTIAPVGSKENTQTVKTVDTNPNYFKDTLVKSNNHPVDQIFIKLKETAEAQKIPAEDVKEFVADFYNLRDKTRAVGIDFDQLLMDTYQNQMGLDEFMSKVQEELYTVKRNDLKGSHTERLDELDKMIKKMKSTKIWSTFGKVFGVIGALAGGLASIATGGLAAALGIALLAVTLTNTVDNALGDPMKKAIGNKVTDGSDSKVDAFAQYFDLGVGVLQMLLGLGLFGAGMAAQTAVGAGAQGATAGAKALQAGQKIAEGVANAGQGVTTLGSSVSTYDLNRTRATLLEKETIAKGDDQDLKEIMELLRRALKQRNSHQESLKQITDMQADAARWIR